MGTGRPPADNPRSVQTRIRMTEDEAKMLAECANKLNTTKTEVVIKGIRKVYSDLKVGGKQNGNQKCN
nr:MAG TPA: hypothetical protein [Caudoviricetes sp.]